jgi:hypothetical protein
MKYNLQLTQYWKDWEHEYIIKELETGDETPFANLRDAVEWFELEEDDEVGLYDIVDDEDANFKGYSVKLLIPDETKFKREITKSRPLIVDKQTAMGHAKKYKERYTKDKTRNDNVIKALYGVKKNKLKRGQLVNQSFVAKDELESRIQFTLLVCTELTITAVPTRKKNKK